MPLTYTFCCDNLWKSILWLWKTLENSGNSFCYFVAMHPAWLITVDQWRQRVNSIGGHSLEAVPDGPEEPGRQTSSMDFKSKKLLSYVRVDYLKEQRLNIT